MSTKVKYLLVELKKSTSFNDAKRAKERLEFWIDVKSVIPFEDEQEIVNWIKEE